MFQKLRLLVGIKPTKIEITQRCVDVFAAFFPECECVAAGELRIRWRYEGMKQPNDADLSALWPLLEHMPARKILLAVDEALAALGEQRRIEAYSGKYGDSVGRSFRERIFPVVRSSKQGASAIAMAAGMPFRPFVGDLIAHYVLDHGDRMSPVLTKDLAEMEIAAEELDAISIGNLRALKLDFTISAEHGFAHCDHGKDYESSLILDNDLIDDFENRLGKDLVVLIPSPSMIIFVRTDSPELAFSLEAGAKIFLEDPKAIAKDPLIRRNGQWAIWPVPEELRPRGSIQ